jgi:hypothetical protein
MAAARHRIGVTYGWLVVIGRAPKPENTSHRLSWWRCRCRCGNEITVRADELDNGFRRSCKECRAKNRLSGVFPSDSEPEEQSYRIRRTIIDDRGETTRFVKR